jgi:hypothetical protein
MWAHLQEEFMGEGDMKAVGGGRGSDSVAVTRRSLLGAGGALGLGVSALALPAATAAASGGSFSPATEGAAFYLFYREDLEGIVTYDTRLRDAALALGLEVVAPR